MLSSALIRYPGIHDELSFFDGAFGVSPLYISLSVAGRVPVYRRKADFAMRELSLGVKS